MSAPSDSEPAQAPAKRRNIRRFLFAGLATLLPTFLTGYIVYWCYNFVHDNLGYWLGRFLGRALGEIGPDEPLRNPAVIFAGDILAVAIVLGLALLVGALAASYLGRRLIRWIEQILSKLPVVRAIYPYIKQVTDFFLGERKIEFSGVVVVPYPRQGVYSIGFVTGGSLRTVNAAAGEEMVRVFIPSSPTPFIGYVLFIPRREVVSLPITMEEAMALLVSGGVIAPHRESPAPPSPAGKAEPRKIEGAAWGKK